METFLTTKQVQELFKVDRITVYRMLQDGRLKGIKIANQWRFSQKEIERLLSGVSLPEEVEIESVFPIHCVQTIQNLYSSVSKFNAFVIDLDGELVTKASRETTFCRLMQLSAQGKAACKASRQQFLAAAREGKTEFKCQAGLSYVGAPILDQGRIQGLFLSGQFFLKQPPEAHLLQKSEQIAKEFHLDQEAVLDALRHISTLTAEQREHLLEQPAAAAQAIESIMSERSTFMKRLQQIADLTQNL